MKYIMLKKEIDKGSMVQYFPVVFPNSLIHQDIAEAVIKVIEEKYKETLQVVSAGECYMHCESVGGNSTTLDLYANPNDAGLINTIDYFPFAEK